MSDTFFAMKLERNFVTMLSIAINPQACNGIWQ